MKTFFKAITLFLFCISILSCGDSYGPGEMRYTWNPSYADLYINDELRHEGDVIITHGDGEPVTIRAVMHPEDGWVFESWNFLVRYFIEGGDSVYSKENPYSFNVGDLPQHLYLGASRYSVDTFTVSDAGDKIFIIFRVEDGKRAGIYSIKSGNMIFFEEEAAGEYTVDTFGRVYYSDRDRNIIYILDWDKEEFIELLHNFSFSDLYSYIGEDNSPFFWAPDLTTCAYIINIQDGKEFLLGLLNTATGVVKTKKLSSGYINEIKWSLDSKNLYILEEIHTWLGGTESRVYKYRVDTLRETEICLYDGSMNSLSGPDEFGNFYFHDYYSGNSFSYNNILRFNEDRGEPTIMFSFDKFKNPFYGVDNNYIIEPSICQYKDTITITTDEGVYETTFYKPDRLFSFEGTTFSQGDKVISVNKSSFFLSKTLRNFAYDLYMYNSAGEEERITRPELFY